MEITHSVVIALVALLVGLWLGRRKMFQARVSPGSEKVSYMQGLNFLLDDKPDKAVEEFVRALEVNPDTLETHLSLGKLMRKQGHVNRAIRIHQNVLARPSLDVEHQHQVHLELARDFMAAGLLDRAEVLLQEVISESAELRSRAQRHLIEIYQDESEWEQAIEVASSLLQSKYVRGQPEEKKYILRMIAHFYCELAQQATNEQDADRAARYLNQAASVDKTGIRVAVLKATKYNVEGNYRQAIKTLGKLSADNPAWFSACLPTLLESFQGLDAQNGTEKLWDHLQSNVAGKPRAAEILFVVDRLLEQPTDARQIALAEEILTKSLDPSSKEYQGEGKTGGDRFNDRRELALMTRKLGLGSAAGEGGDVQLLKNLHQNLEAHLSSFKTYRCNNCGFSGRQLHWRCPSCKRWDSCQRIDQTEA